MPFDFPASPPLGSQFVPVVGGPQWQWNGSAWVSSGGSALGMAIIDYYYTSSGTYTPGNGVLYADAECWGGGGAGGGVPSTGSGIVSIGSGGNAGAYSKALLTPSQIGTSIAMTIGASGVGVSGAAGGAGGITSFGALVSANGGQGGQIGGPASGTFTANPSAPTQSTAGDIWGWTQMGSKGVAGSATVVGGDGAGSLFGGGGRGGGQAGAGQIVGGAAGGRAAGGGGAAGVGVGSAVAGGNGVGGFIHVREYYSFTGSAPAPGTIIRRVITTSGTWNRPNGCIAIDVEVQSAGGGGSPANGTSANYHSCGTGGGAGGYCKKLIANPPASATLTIAASAGNGTAGGTTSYSDGSSTLTANGGNSLGAPAAINVTIWTLGPYGGTATGGDINITGSPGGWSHGTVTGAAVSARGGAGGDSVLGKGARPTGVGTSGSALTATGEPAPSGGYGGGGGGGVSVNGSLSVAGGASTQGVAIITENY